MRLLAHAPQHAFRAAPRSIKAKYRIAARRSSSRPFATMTHPGKPPIAIIGAGPAGLMLGRLLELSKIQYTIFERDEAPELRTGSGTLDVHPNSGQLALKAAGLLDQFNARARHGTSTTIADKDAKVIIKLGGEGDKQRPEIDRQDLQRIIQEAVPRERIQWGSKIQQVTRHGDGVRIHFANGKVESGYRLVVGGDGAWSKVRSIYTDKTPKYTGVTFFTTYIKPSDAGYGAAERLAGKGSHLSMDGSQKIFIYYLGNQSYFLSIGLGLTEPWSSDNELLKDATSFWQSVLEEPFQGWTSQLTDLIKESEGDFRAWPLYNLPSEALGWSPLPGVTMIGDAAHLTVPTGEGVNNAMFDSFELSKHIIEHGVEDLDQAVIEYEKTMMPRAVAAIKKGEWFSDVLFGAGAPASFLRAIGIEQKGK